MNNTAVEQMKTGVAEMMQSEGQAAILWSQAMFISTGLPLITDASGATHTVYGLALTPEGTLTAITGLPAGMTLHGLLILSFSKPLPEGLTTDSAGTPSQWSVLCDCYENSMQLHHAQLDEKQPLPWW